jgi:hypothetical protein
VFFGNCCPILKFLTFRASFGGKDVAGVRASLSGREDGFGCADPTPPDEVQLEPERPVVVGDLGGRAVGVKQP